MISLELLTVLVVGPLACLVCYDIAKKNPRANIIMTIIATAELYGGRPRSAMLRLSPGLLVTLCADRKHRFHDVLSRVADREPVAGW